MPAQAKTGKALLIVESPSKVKTISSYLGEDYLVDSSMGHIRDLPQPSELPENLKKSPVGKFAVNVEENFEPYYVVNPDKKKKVAELKRKLKEVDALYLATDGDREGEAIAWHLKEVLKPKVPVYRMTFPEITREAIQRAFGELRDIDLHLVDAQETRRILDRIYGYEISPVLWRKVGRGLSAGRVQSVATRLVVERERERMAFVAANYWDLTGRFLTAASEGFDAKLVAVDGNRIATGKDFADNGTLNTSKVTHLNEEAARALAAALQSAAFSVRSVETKPYKRRPAAPFTTSTLQQEAARKLRFSSRVTMQVAQRLYENGYITYMRTDSTALSSQAIHAAREQATQLYGAEAVAESPRLYGTTSKGAQEAHEAIRPAGDHFRTPGEVAGSLSKQQLALYDLIWKRTVASQMADALGYTATIRVLTGIEVDGKRHDVLSSASGTVITSPGFRLAYQEGRDQGRYDAEKNDAEKTLPDVAEGDAATLTEATPDGHETQPPGRYTEATLVKTMEELGIGRPSTYAATIQTIGDRGYVTHRGQYLVPTWLAFSVTRLLEENLANLVDYDFTASMEGDLDRIAAGQENGTDFLTGFFFGPDGTGEHGGLRHDVASLGDDIDARAVNSIDLGRGVTLRVGRYGPYMEKADGTRANVPPEVAPDELTDELIDQLFARAADDGRELGVDPATGHTIIVKDGRYGPYVTEVLPEPTEDAEEGAKKTKKTAAKPRTASLFKTMDIATVTLEDALNLLSLPREVGTDPASGDVITAQNGRYGPYLKKGTDSRTLASEDQLLTITLDEALAIYAQPKTRGRGTARPPLREFGEDPISGKKVTVKDGRFGPDVTDGETNVTVPRAETVEDLTAERAYELLADKRAKGPAPKRTRKTAAKKTTTKKTTAAKKTTTKKTTAAKKTTTAKKTATKKAATKKDS